jgi:hypothetical protein
MKKKKIPYYHFLVLKICKKYKLDKAYAKKCGWSIDYGFGIDKPHFHTPYGDLYWDRY